MLRPALPPKSRVVIAALVVAAAAALAQKTPAPATPGAYADPALCATCHQEIADSFAKTGMGRSLYRLTPQNAIENFGKPYYHAASDTYLEMIARGGRYFQRRWQLGFDGRETNVDEKQVDYVIGSGNHVRTYAHLTARNTLQQLPLSWYSEKGGYWAMSPGYDRPDNPESTRVVNYPCMFCHNAYPKIPKAAEEADALPEFGMPLPEGIDCQRCHGPGQKHAETADPAAIVNPRRLSSDRELEVCMQCHLQTTALALPHSIQRLGAGPFSYIPGQSMETFRLTFDRAGGMNDKFEIAHTAYRLRESQCFLKSAGKLRCTTCHDPHSIPASGTATARYSAICRNCHSGEIARATPAASAHASNADCVSCHMPKRRTDDVVHVVMTDHLIQRRPPPGDLVADKAEVRETPATAYHGEVVPYYPATAGTNEQESALYLALAQISDGTNLQAGLPRMTALLERYRPPQPELYTALANGFRKAGDLAEALPWYEEAVRQAPASAIILRNLGSVQMDLGDLTKAEATLRLVTTLAPRDPEAWGMLGQVMWTQGRGQEGKAALTRAIELDSEVPDLHSSLATFLLKDGDAPGAEKEIREALRIRPGNASVQANLASLLASRGADEEARYHFRQSINLNPAAAEVRLNYARLLASLDEPAEAQTQAEAAVAANRNLAAAHELLGSLLGSKGDVDGAFRELQQAVRLEPHSGSAQFKLGVAYGLRKDRAAAVEHLKLAVAGNDPEARQSAQDLLQKLGQ